MSYIICFWDKSKLQVSDDLGEKLKAAITAESIKTFELGSSLYSVSGVEKIIPKDEAYRTFADEWQTLKELEDKQSNGKYLPALESPKLT